MRVLIVDDDESSCRLLAKVIKRTGAEADWTTDSQSGFARSLQYQYDLYILDVQMPGLSGTDFAADLKQQRPGAHILLISAFADYRLQQTASRLGVSLLSKPFTPNALIDATVQALSVCSPRTLP